MTGKKKILIVDDSEIILNITKEYLSGFDVEILISRNGLEGLKKAIESKPDIILLDILMPNFDGIKMLQVIKLMNELRDVPVIVISGNTDKVNVLTAMEAGAEQVLAKPVSKEKLIESIEKAINDKLPPKIKSPKSAKNAEIDEDLMLQLKKLFVENFSTEKHKLIKAITDNNKEPIQKFVHNAKSVGATIGYPQLRKVNEELEKLLNEDQIDWEIIKLKFNQISLIVKDLENSLAVW